ncbi:MAG TPA: dihydropteroate synthase [Puia sp.]|nr:dihydropteroate synthase [Puia sp.]
MGVVNVTHDSFYPGSRIGNDKELLNYVEKSIHDGADFIDIGGQSTRPNADEITPDEELKRVITPLDLLSRQFPEILLSIDTFHSQVAAEAIAAGASVINDVSGGMKDSNILSVAAQNKAPFICMHMKGTPKTMQLSPQYENVVEEVLDYFVGRLEACKRAGINDVIIDPGFGFGKNSIHNFGLLKNLSVFKELDKPILIGVSRKSTISRILGVTVNEALNGTTVLNTIALLNGAQILRVHDVKEAKQAIRIFTEYADAPSPALS